MMAALPSWLRRVVLGVGLVALAVTAVQVGIGPFRVEAYGVRFSSSSLVRPVLVFLLTAALLSRRSDRGATLADLRRLDGWLDRVAAWIALAAAMGALAAGLVWGTRAAGGSDSYCYIGQAEEFAAGRAILREPLATAVALPRPDLVFAPVGFVPSPRGGAVPMCAPGLSLVMAAAWKAGGARALHAVVPVLGALCVWCAFLLGRRLWGATAGAWAAVLLSCSPVFLYQAVQPMSDVPAALFWSAALVLAGRGDRTGQWAAGAIASLAILTRPNIVPAVLPIAGYLGVTAGRAAIARFAASAIPGCVLLAWLNQIRYGSAWRTGYGDVDVLFSLANVLPNAARYADWTLAAQTPLILLALAAPFLVQAPGSERRPARAVFAWLGVAFAMAILACYLPYTVFDAWWYTRFLLPALPITLALSAAAVAALAGRAGIPLIVVLPWIAALAAFSLTYAQSHDVFALRTFERRFITVGTYVGRQLPENAVVITIQQSGSVRHYGHRPAALWDAFAPDALDEAVSEFERIGRRPYLLLEDWEEANFRERFAGERLGALDWRPAAEIRDHLVVRLYDPRDRR
jgi:hypothetical protein